MAKGNKPTLTHEHEEKIAFYCAQNEKQFNLATAYDLTLETFENDPILLEEEDANGEKKSCDVTKQIARSIEFHPRTIERIAAKIDLAGETIKLAEYATNIKTAKAADKPDLDKLVDNLYRLNIVDRNSYLAFICFLMQLKHSRDDEVPENDKTCVFFNGVARNGKSATAQAIYDVEAQYGKVFKAQSGKLLESTHEEQIWKSHLNYFDEVKPSEVDRELLFTIINGGEVELNPKNKTPYNQHVNTNNIFTSNDQINMKQRRISLIKFGDRINGRPLGKGTLKEVISEIMNSLPSFERYFEIYGLVSVANELRLNPLAIEHIMTFLEGRLGSITPEYEQSLGSHTSFSAHDVYNCVRTNYTRQIIKSEHKESIKIALKHLVECRLLQPVFYEACTTQYYKASALDLIKIREQYNAINTADEDNTKLSKEELRILLQPFFMPPGSFPPVTNINDKERLSKAFVNLTAALTKAKTKTKGNSNAVTVGVETLKNAKILYSVFEKRFYSMMKNLKYRSDSVGTAEIAHVIGLTLTEDLCRVVHYDVLAQFFKSYFNNFDDSCRGFLIQRYKELTHCFDDKLLEIQARSKAPNVDAFARLNPTTNFFFERYQPGGYKIALDDLKEQTDQQNELVVRKSKAFDEWVEALKEAEIDAVQTKGEIFQKKLPSLEVSAPSDGIPF